MANDNGGESTCLGCQRVSSPLLDDDDEDDEEDVVGAPLRRRRRASARKPRERGREEPRKIIYRRGIAVATRRPMSCCHKQRVHEGERESAVVDDARGGRKEPYGMHRFLVAGDSAVCCDRLLCV